MLIQIMKRILLAVLFFFTLLLSLSAQVRPDEIRLDYKVLEKGLEEVLLELSDKTEVNIPFANNLIPEDYSVTASFRNEELGEILNQILNKTELSFKIVGDQIVIIKDEYKYAPDFITVSGRVTDKLSGEPLAYCDISIESSNKASTTNEFGFYKMTIPNGLNRIYYRYLAYEYRVVELKAKADTILNISMQPKALLNEVLILDKSVDEVSSPDQQNTSLALDKLQSIASLGGEADLASLALLSSGVSSGADGVGGLNVRGGSADQNLILLDGTPIYGMGHALGIFSNFNPNIVRSANLHKGSIPARYNGRLSSVLDVKLKDGNLNKTKGDVSLGAIALKSTIEGPLSPGKSSYLISFRRSILDLWIQNASEYINELNEREGSSDFYFYDINTKLRFKLSNKHDLNLSYYRGKDELGNSVNSDAADNGVLTEELNADNWQWSNNVLSLKLNSQYGSNFFGKLNLYQTSLDLSVFDYQRFIETSNNEESLFYSAGRYTSKISDLGLKYDLDYMLNDHNYIRFGTSIVRHSFEPGVLRVNEGDQIVEDRNLVTVRLLDDILEADNRTANEIDLYVEDDIAIGKYTRLNIGVSLNSIMTDNTNYILPLPRIALTHKGKVWSMNIGLSRMSQFQHMVSNTALGLPTSVWLPSSAALKPENSWILNAGTGYVTDAGIGLAVGAYYKYMNNLLSSQEGGISNIGEGIDWDQSFASGNGSAYGVEFDVDKRFGNFTWFFNYTYSRSNRLFDLLNNSQEFDFQYDRRHQFKLALIQKINKNAEFSLNWQYGTGNPITAPVELLPFTDVNGIERLLPIYSSKNNTKLPDYHRMDIVFSFYNNFDWAKQKISLGLYNAYNQRNPFYIDLRNNPDSPSSLSLFQYSLLPILPVLNYSLAF